MPSLKVAVVMGGPSAEREVSIESGTCVMRALTTLGDLDPERATALMERLRNAVWWIGRGLTVQELLEDALEKICTDLEKKHNGGKPFPQRQGELARSKRKNKPPGSNNKKK